jgi:uncharacterized protein (TIGR02265 family)
VTTTPLEPAALRPSLTVDVARARAELDLEARLRRIPDGAALRGVWFKSIADAIGRAGPGAVAAFKHLAPPKSRWFFRLYPLGDYLDEIAVAAAILAPRDAREGVAAIWRHVHEYSGFLHPNTFMRLLRPDPVQPMRWLVKHHDHFANFGAFRLEERGPGEAVMHLVNEYIWIDAAHRAGCTALLAACGVEGDVRVELDDDFNGRLYISWTPR